MLEMFSHNKITLVVVALVLAGSVWYTLSGSSSQPEGLVTENFTVPESEADRDLVATLLQLRSVRLDGTVFSDPAFQSLRDFGSQIVSEPVGRQNPFAPLFKATPSTTTPASQNVGR